MRETEFYGQVNGLKQTLQQLVTFINNFQQAIRLDSTGKEIRLLALQRLAIKKGLFTEAELTTESGDVIKQMQKEAEEAAKKASEQAVKPEIVKPTTEQVQQVTNTPVSEEVVKEVIPPAQA